MFPQKYTPSETEMETVQRNKKMMNVLRIFIQL